jgi:hypothetical protein
MTNKINLILIIFNLIFIFESLDIGINRLLFEVLIALVLIYDKFIHK